MTKLIAVTAVALCASLLAGASFAAEPTPAARKAEWAKIADLPDWSGVWEVDWANKRGSKPKPPMKLTLKYQQQLAEFRKAQEKGENLQNEGANCRPPGLPGIMTQPYPIEFLYVPGKIVMVTEAYMQYRHIYLDGRTHPEDPDLTFHGHSTGHWDKDTLVVDTVGLNEENQLASGVPHSEQLRIVERIRKVSPQWMEIETTLIDPVVLAEPYTSVTSYRHLDDELREYVCVENNRDAADEKGRPTLKLE